MKILLCLSMLAVSSYATYVGYPYVYRNPVVQNGFYPPGYGFSTFGSPSLTVIKPYYPGFYEYRLGLSPGFYQPGLYPGGGLFAGSPTIIHLIPTEPESSDKKKPKKKDKKGKEGKDEETTTATPEDGEKEELENAEARDGDSAAEKSDSVEVETV